MLRGTGTYGHSTVSFLPNKSAINLYNKDYKDITKYKTTLLHCQETTLSMTQARKGSDVLATGSIFITGKVIFSLPQHPYNLFSFR
jgi:hypothetical protein